MLTKLLKIMVAGEEDFLMPHGKKLLESYIEPTIITHPKGHTIPRLGNTKFKLISHFCLNTYLLNF